MKKFVLNREKKHHLFKVRILQQLFFIFICLFPIFFMSTQRVYSAILDVEILSNLKVTNTSGTTTSNRWAQQASNQPVTFEITGNSLVSANVLTGEKTAVLLIPEELVGRVLPNGNATLQANVTVDLSKVALLANVLTLVGDLTNLIARISSGALGSLSGVTINLTEVNTQLALLKSFENFGQASFNQPQVLSSDKRLITTSVDKGLGPVLGSNLAVILTNLLNAVKNLKATGSDIASNLVAVAINSAIDLVRTPLVTALNTVIPTLTGTGPIIQQLADASTLGNTDVKMPTLVSGPTTTYTTNLDTKFIGTVVKSSAITVSLISGSSSQTFIYFQGEYLSLQENLLPTNLDFGTHKIQTVADERFTAQSNSQNVTATISITDTRTKTKNWQMKVMQTASWQNGASQLNTGTLKILAGGVTGNFPSSDFSSVANTTVDLALNTQKELISVKNSAAKGGISLAINQFDLFVPKNTRKMIGTYQTTLVWTLTDGP